MEVFYNKIHLVFFIEYNCLYSNLRTANALPVAFEKYEIFKDGD
jgi:hypothetical protein